MLSIPEQPAPHSPNTPSARIDSATPAAHVPTSAPRSRAVAPSECADCGNFALALYPGGLCRSCDLSADSLALVMP